MLNSGRLIYLLCKGEKKNPLLSRLLPFPPHRVEYSSTGNTTGEIDPNLWSGSQDVKCFEAEGSCDGTYKNKERLGTKFQLTVGNKTHLAEAFLYIFPSSCCSRFSQLNVCCTTGVHRLSLKITAPNCAGHLATSLRYSLRPMTLAHTDLGNAHRPHPTQP